MTAAENPYEVLPEEPGSDYPQMEVDPTGRLLIVQSPVRLPNRCVFTNLATTPDDVLHESLGWYGKTSFKLTLSKYCRIHYSVAPGTGHAHRLQSIRWKLIFGWGIVLVLGMALGMSAVEAVVLVLLALLVDGVLSYKAGKVPRLEVVDYQNERFWIAGCSSEFLEQLQRDLAGG